MEAAIQSAMPRTNPLPNMPAPPAAVPGRYPWLDAWRGAAALLVVCYHARAILWIGTASAWKRYGWHPDWNAAAGYLLTPFNLGYLGVVIFFVLSGFSIHLRGARRIVAEGQAARLPLGTFYWRRLVRIYPTYCAALVLVACVDAYLLGRIPDVVGQEDHRASTFLLNLATLPGIAAPVYGTSGVFWTLVLEIHFYLAYPLLFHLSRRRTPEAVLAGTLAVSLATLLGLRWLHAAERWPYWHAGGPVFLRYWFVWALGFYVAEAVVGRAQGERWLRRRYGLLAIVGMLLLNVAGEKDLAEFCFAFAFAAAVRHFAVRPRIGRSRLVRGAAIIGLFSYSLYCVHLPLLFVARAWFLQGESTEAVLPMVAGVLLAVGGGALFFLAVEQWFLRPGLRRERAVQG